jgi:hypothetical protein
MVRRTLRIDQDNLVTIAIPIFSGCRLTMVRGLSSGQVPSPSALP